MINSKILSSDHLSSNSHVYYDEYIQTTKPQFQSPHEVNQDEKIFKNQFKSTNIVDLKRRVWIKETSTKTWEEKEEVDFDEGDKESNLVGCSDELVKRADDFIARVNRHRMFELSLMQNGSY